ncbi:hypothetical protein PVAP13_8KG093884 [Panicum virgatum]|uniref:Uncharacterized protein n=1 Tax=Panicum virgatum TaxID=38727 RepID=A0A8T0PIE1_PANVG|nr:hypothetical protein PVAP13_8KG093884 [Panicum virgatum]
MDHPGSSRLNARLHPTSAPRNHGHGSKPSRISFLYFPPSPSPDVLHGGARPPPLRLLRRPQPRPHSSAAPPGRKARADRADEVHPRRGRKAVSCESIYSVFSSLEAFFSDVLEDPVEAVLLGAKNAAIAGTVVAVPTLVGCRVLPWAKANLNYTAQTLIISAGTILLFSLLIVHVCALFAQYSLLNDSF